MSMSPDDRPSRAPGSTAASTTSSGPGAPAPPRRRRPAPSPDGATAVEPAISPIAREPVSEPITPAPEPRKPRPAKRARRAPAPEPRPAPSALTEAVIDDDEPEEDYTQRKRRRPPKARASSGARGERRYRQTLVKVDLWSVTKLSLCFYLSAMFVTIVAMIALWLIADAAGIIKSVEDFFGDLLSAKNFKFLSGEVLRGTILVGLVVVALQVVITVIAAVVLQHLLRALRRARDRRQGRGRLALVGIGGSSGFPRWYRRRLHRGYSSVG